MFVFEESTYRLPGYIVNSKVPFYPLKSAVQCVKYSTILGENLAVQIPVTIINHNYNKIINYIFANKSVVYSFSGTFSPFSFANFVIDMINW